jgi:hypothetical protein
VIDDMMLEIYGDRSDEVAYRMSKLSKNLNFAVHVGPVIVWGGRYDGIRPFRAFGVMSRSTGAGCIHDRLIAIHRL